MAALDLVDEIGVELAPTGSGVAVEMEPALDIPAEKTLVARVTERLACELGQDCDLRIRVKRNIPDKSGLGSSSTDAAAVLRALCSLWGVDALDARVVALAREAGADVAFFLNPVPSWLDGVGDCLRETFMPLPGLSVALVRPEGGVSTVEAYREFDAVSEAPCSPEALCALLRSGRVDARSLAERLYNNLQPASERLQPQVREVRTWLEARPETVGTLMCGSGSCVFSLCERDDAAQAIARDARALGWWSCATNLR